MNRKNMQLTSWLAGIFPILVWSSVAGLLRFRSDSVDPLQVAFIAILSGSLFAFLASLIFDKEYKAISKKNLKNKKLIAYSVVAGMFICCHYFSIYYIFSTDFAIPGNIINYLWPLFLYLLLLTAGTAKSKSPPSDIVFMLMAFVGVFSVLYGHDRYQAGQGEWAIIGLAFISAISAAAYFFLSGKIREITKGFITFMFYPLFFAGVFSIIFFLTSYEILNINNETFIVGIFLGLVSLFISNSLWVFAVSTNSSKAFSSLAYLTPILSTILILIINNEQIDKFIISGLTLVVIANIFIHFRGAIVHSWKICLALIVTSGVICSLIYPLKNSVNPQVFTASSTIFSLFSAFLLNRVWQKRREEITAIHKVAEHVNNFLGSKTEFELRQKVLNFYLANKNMLRIEFLSLCSLIDFYKSETNYKETALLKTALTEWRNIRNSSISGAEILMLTLICFITVVQLILFRSDSLMGDFVCVIFSASLAFIVYLIHEYDQNGHISKNNIDVLIGDHLSENDLSKGAVSDILFDRTDYFNQPNIPLFRALSLTGTLLVLGSFVVASLIISNRYPEFLKFVS